MIIGKSLTALGGGGLKPEICVTAQAGAALNLHYNGSSIILQSYQLGAVETQHTFIVDVSETAYVVEDMTNGVSVEVLVDAVAQYSVEIVCGLWLYRNGDECEDVTGGWIEKTHPKRGFGNYSGYAFTKNSNSIYVKGATTTNAGEYGCQTSNRIDLSGYSTLNINILSGASSNAYNNECAIYLNTKTDGANMAYSVPVNTTGKVSFDLSNYNDAYYIGILGFAGSAFIEFNKVWLE